MTAPFLAHSICHRPAVCARAAALAQRVLSITPPMCRTAAGPHPSPSSRACTFRHTCSPACRVSAVVPMRFFASCADSRDDAFVCDGATWDGLDCESDCRGEGVHTDNFQRDHSAEEDETGHEMPEFEFDPMASMQRDAAVESAKQSIQSIVGSMLPQHAPASAVAKTYRYLEQHPIDTLIVHPQVVITHVQNSETLVEEKVSVSPCSCAEALAQARERQMNLVQMGSRDDVAFCRIRNESVWIMKLVGDDLAAAASATSSEAGTEGYTEGSLGTHSADETTGRSERPRAALPEGSGYHQPTKPRPQVEHAFRDMVDAHFIGWKSKKICQDLRKGHPVKLTIRDFQSAEAAVTKLREMCQAMRTYAEAEKITHNYTSIVAHDREASITFVPVYATTTPVNNSDSKAVGANNAVRVIKHPSEKDWTHTLTRMQTACRKAGILGTYAKSNKLKPRNLGMRTYRVDKYGRRLD